MKKASASPPKKVRPLKTSRRAAEKAHKLMPHLGGTITARDAGMTVDKLSRWLNGTGHIYIDELWRLSKVLGVTMEYLCDDAQIGPPDRVPEESRPIFRIGEDVTAPRKPKARLKRRTHAMDK